MTIMPIRVWSIPVSAFSLFEELELVEGIIKRVQYLRLKTQLLEGSNPEINTDKETLVSRMEELGFRRDIVDAIHDLDRKVYEAGKPLDFKACMDLVRSIFEKVVEEAARKAAALATQTTGSASKFQHWKQLLISLGVLTEDEGEVTQKLSNYISNAGVHQLGSAPEQVRVAKNTVVEWSLLIVGRVKPMK